MMRQQLYAAYRSLPPPLRTRVRNAWQSISSIVSKRSRWVRNQYTAHGLAERRRIFMDIAQFAHINRPIGGYYLEFGSHEANTMRMAFDCFRYLFDWHFVAFDSFEGLPEISAIDRQMIWEKGKLKTGESEFIRKCVGHGIPRDRLTTVKGFYEHTLTSALQARFLPRKAAVVYVDCDLYASTVPVLEFIRPFLQPGTVVVFDDWNCFLADPDRGERRAWREFLEKYPDLRFQPFAITGMQMAFVYVGSHSSQSAT